MKKRLAHIVPVPLRRHTAQPAALAYEEVQRSNSPDKRERAGSIIRSVDSSAALMRLLQNRAVETAEPSPVTADSDQRLPVLDYLCVCGLLSERSPAPQVLGHAPEAVKAESLLHRFCFPDGRPPVVTGCDLSVHPIEDIRRGDNTFMFCLGASSLYVYVVRSWEILEEPPPWTQSRVPTALASTRHLTLRAYCIVSRNPYGRLFWELLFHMARLERDRLTADDTERRRRREERQNALLKIIGQLCEQRCVPGFAVKLKSEACFGAARKIEFQMPDAANSARVCIIATCLPALMRAFSPQNLVALLCASLTESKVLFHGTSSGRVAACTLALAAAIAPFTWQTPPIALVPHQQTELMQSPVPVLCGCVMATLDYDNANDDMRVLVASIDADTVRVLGAPLPALPCADVLESTLCEAHMCLRDTLRSRQDDTPFAPLNDRDAHYIYSAVEALNQYTVWLLDSIRRLLPDGAYTMQTLPDGMCHSPDNPAVCAQLLEQVTDKSRDFVDSLLNTQHYQAIATTFGDLPAPEAQSSGAYRDCRL